MTTKQALEDLRDKVKAGAAVRYALIFDAFGKEASRLHGAFSERHNTSLNEAKKLHEVALPDWHFSVATEANGKGFCASVSPKEWAHHSQPQPVTLPAHGS